MVTAIWVCKWHRLGVAHFVDFDNQDDALEFARKLEESHDRDRVLVMQHEAPEPDAETMARIKARILQRVKGQALVGQLNG